MKAVSRRSSSRPPPIEHPPGGGDPATEPDAAAVGADTVNKSGCNSTEENFRLLAIPTDLKNRGMQER